MLKLENLKRKKENGMTLYFYAGLGWVTAERLSQPDVAENEAVKDFDCNPENSRKCSDCPHNRNFSDWQDKLPCGQWHCWVDVTYQKGETRYEN
jgi:hypothetical protein